MKLSGLLVAAIVLVALTGTLYWSNHRKPAVADANASTDTPPKILALNQTDITALEIKKKSGEDVVLAKNDGGKWQITSPKPFGADQVAVSNILAGLSPLNSERLVEDKAANLIEYGLTQPSIEVDISQKNKKTEKLLIGDDTPTGNGAYATLAGDSRVFTLASYNKSSFDKGVNDLRDKRLFTYEPDKLSRVELTAKRQTIEFGRDKDQWQILKPRPLRADQSTVEEMLRALHDAQMDLSGGADEKKAATAFSSGSPLATLKITDVSGTQELQVRKNKEDYYGKSSAVEGVYKLSGTLGTALDKSLDDFRNKKLFDFGFADPDKIELHDGPKSYFLSRSGTDWWSNGKKMDQTSVQLFLGKIRDLSASKFVDSGFTTSELELTVTSNEGKRVEKVLVSKNGDRYVAKRENEPALYELEATSVSDLQKSADDLKSAADIKPSAPAKK